MLSWPAASAIIDVGGGCTLVDAITAANTDATVPGSSCTAGLGNDEIRLSADVTLTQVDNTIAGGAGTTAGPNGLPVIVSTIVIEGNGHTIARSAAAPAFRILSIASGDVGILNTTLTNGGGASFDYLGGAISIAFGAGATIVLANSTVSGNSAGGFSGGGGGIYNASNSAFISGTTISGNSAFIGGGLLNSGIASLTNSTLSGNSGGFDKGGAIDNTGTVTLVNSTLSGNSAHIGGPVGAGGGAINVFSGEARLTNTLLGDNSPANCTAGMFPAAKIIDNGGNLADDGSCDAIPSTLSGLDTSLADNGGPMRTHALLPGSTAIDTAETCGLPTDQRGAPRPTGDCDSGAYEFIDCPDLELDLAESGEQTYENCQRIVTVPNFAVTGTGNVTLRAGSAVLLGEGTEVDLGGRLTIELDPDLQLIPPP
jgi:hypothetical protein